MNRAAVLRYLLAAVDKARHASAAVVARVRQAIAAYLARVAFASACPL